VSVAGCSPRCRIVLTMDLPSVCPICDSERVNYTYVLRHDAAAHGTLVFRCADCGSYVESLITDFDPPADEPRSAPPTPSRRNACNRTVISTTTSSRHPLSGGPTSASDRRHAGAFVTEVMPLASGRIEDFTLRTLPERWRRGSCWDDTGRRTTRHRRGHRPHRRSPTRPPATHDRSNGWL